MKGQRIGMLVLFAAGLALTAPAGFAPVLGAEPTTAPAAGAPQPAPAAATRDVAAKEWFRRIPPGTFRPDASVRPELPDKIDQAFVIPIEGALMQESMLDSLKRKIAQAKARGGRLVVFDIDSPGGRSDLMNAIVKMVHNDLGDVYTVAYAREAFSAAAIISLACDEIVLAPGARFGDAMPIFAGPGGVMEMPAEVRKKLESAFRADLRAMAERHHYNVALVEAMVTSGRQVWLVRERASGALRIVSARDVAGRVAKLPPGATGADEPNPEAPLEYVATIDGPDEILTLTSREVVRVGLAEHILKDLDALREHYNVVGEFVILQDSPTEELVGFLTSPLVTSILLMAGLFCLYTEIRTPGFGIFGILGIACLAVLFGSRYLTGLAQWWEIGLFFVGLVLIALEVFVIPGFGVAGISGILCCLVALAAIVIPNAPDEWPIPQTDLDWSLFEAGAFALLVGFVLAFVLAAVAARYLPKSRLARGLMLAPSGAGGGPPVTEDSPMARVQVGDVGTVEGVCRPVGKVRFGDDLLDAATESEILERGAAVRVLRRDGNRLIVERAQERA